MNEWMNQSINESMNQWTNEPFLFFKHWVLPCYYLLLYLTSANNTFLNGLFYGRLSSFIPPLPIPGGKDNRIQGCYSEKGLHIGMDGNFAC